MSVRRPVLLLLGALCLTLGVGAWREAGGPDPQAVEHVRAALAARAAGWIAAGDLARADGYTYTIDRANLLLAAARRGELAIYLPLRDALAAEVVVDRPDDPYTAGFVLWRHRAGEPGDASGTTEALRLARGLRAGAARFGRPDDARLAHRILHGYLRHATVDQGVWLVRNYFVFATRAFANDAYLVDFDPDLLAEVASDARDPVLGEAATRSLALVRAARGPSGLFKDLVQPDLRTLMPEWPFPAFSPDGATQLNNACAVAETVAVSDPRLAMGVLRFAERRLGLNPRRLRRDYDVRTGEPRSGRSADVTALSCLVRLSRALGEPHAERRFARAALPRWRWLADPDTARDVYAVSDALVALSP